MKEIENLWEEIRDLSLGTTIQHLPQPPTPLQFLRHFVSQNKPCIISNAISHWPALTRWPHHSYLSHTLSHSLVSLHLTPTGLADSLVSSSDTVFASAHVQRVPFTLALDMVVRSREGCVAYLQQQNDCFRAEFSELASDCDGEIAWASEALGCGPEAVNLWIGNELSETSFHKDHYENIYAVVSGKKHFLLLPPTDVHRLYVREYPAANYCYDQESGEFTLEMEEPERLVPWCSVNPYPSPEMEEGEKSKFPLYFNGPKPFQCTVNAGEILYLFGSYNRHEFLWFIKVSVELLIREKSKW